MMSGFKRLSRLFAPLRKFKPNEKSSSVDLLTNYGYLRQSSSGIYNILPLGNSVQNKIESIIRKRLDQVDCAEASLATLASSKIWKASGRLQTGNEFFMLEDDKFLLAPTHEEEITTMMTELSSYKQVPLRLFQISKKYRNEKRPRGGLLRGREFTMKDLYSFDESKDGALVAYKEIQGAYDKIFNDIGLKVEVAEADSGSIGGSLSHEYHYISDAGEDSVVKCNDCGYTANIERAVSGGVNGVKAVAIDGAKVQFFTAQNAFKSKSNSSFVIISYSPGNRNVNTHVLKEFRENTEYDLIEVNKEDVLSLLGDKCTIIPVIDARIDFQSENVIDLVKSSLNTTDKSINFDTITIQEVKHSPIVEVEKGESCPSCKSSLDIHQAIEVGHTFYLGTKYSTPLNAKVTTSSSGRMEPLYMGCYGIGVSRLISAIAEVSSDKDGLVWPKSVSPFDAIIVSNNEEDAKNIHHELVKYSINSVWDDRSNQFGVLLANARGIGFPLAIVVGKHYKQTGLVEIQIRNKPTKEGTVSVSFEHLASTARSLLDKYSI